jgi:hypothetical protein
MRWVLLHYHILKNAGSTIECILTRNFGENFASFDSPRRNGVVPNDSLLSLLDRNPGLKAVSSHQTRYPAPSVPGILFFDVCFLRDPIDRLRSTYDYFRKKPSPGDPISDLANTRELGRFAEGLVEDFPNYVNDAQVVLLANGGVYDHPPGEKDLERAIDRVRKASVPGVVDCFDESLVAGQYFLTPVFPNLDCAYPPANVSGDPESTLDSRKRKFQETCDSRVYAQLLRLNALDSKLVDEARAEVWRRFKLVPKHEDRLRALRARVQSYIAGAVPEPSEPPKVAPAGFRMREPERPADRS